VGSLEKELEVFEITVIGMDGGVVGDVVAVIGEGKNGMSQRAFTPSSCR